LPVGCHQTQVELAQWPAPCWWRTWLTPLAA